MAPTRTPDKPVAHDYLRITYTDGRVETVDVSKSIYLYDASDLLGLTEPDVANPIRLTYWLAWVAAGTPHLNGAAPGDTAAARAAARTWLAEDVQTIEEIRGDAAGPPTKSRARSRTSRA